MNKYGQVLVLYGMKQKYVRRKEQLAWYLRIPLENMSHNFISSK